MTNKTTSETITDTATNTVKQFRVNRDKGWPVNFERFPFGAVIEAGAEGQPSIAMCEEDAQRGYLIDVQAEKTAAKKAKKTGDA